MEYFRVKHSYLCNKSNNVIIPLRLLIVVIFILTATTKFIKVLELRETKPFVQEKACKGNDSVLTCCSDLRCMKYFSSSVSEFQ